MLRRRPDADEVLQALGHLAAIDVQMSCKTIRHVTGLAFHIKGATDDGIYRELLFTARM
jgi:hypothetical protein